MLVDSERQYRRILGWVRTTQPEFVDRIKLYSDSVPLFERYGVEQAIRSTLNRRVDLPSGGYLIFDYAEAFTVIDVNTGRFVGSSGRLEDTITRNNIEAAREVMRQLRLRDIGGIIVIDFIDMASAKNRAEVLKVLQAELEKDRTKTYLVEISPLGLVEMTRQNVTEGVREILTRTCPTCGGEGVVLSEQTMAVEAERRLRRLARVVGRRGVPGAAEREGRIAAWSAPGGMKLLELERETGKCFTLEPVERMPLSEVDVIREGTRAEIDGDGLPVADGDERTVKISEPHMYNVTDGVARIDGGYPVVVGGAIGYVGQQHKVRIERATRTAAYATLLDAKPTAIDLPPEPGDYELPEFDREVGERLELEQRTRPRTRRKAPAKPARRPRRRPTADADAKAADDGTAAPKPRRRTRAKPAAEAAAADGAPRRRRPTSRPRPMRAPTPATDGAADVVDGGREAATRPPPPSAGAAASAAAAGGRGRRAPTATASAPQADADPGAAPSRTSASAAAAAADAEPAAAPRTRRRAPARRTPRPRRRRRTPSPQPAAAPAAPPPEPASAAGRARRAAGRPPTGAQPQSASASAACWGRSSVADASGTIPRLMYAVIKVGGKQYRVEQGQKLLVDRQPHAAGEAFTPDVLMTGGDEVVTDRDEAARAPSRCRWSSTCAARRSRCSRSSPSAASRRRAGTARS